MQDNLNLLIMINKITSCIDKKLSYDKLWHCYFGQTNHENQSYTPYRLTKGRTCIKMREVFLQTSHPLTSQ